MPLPPLTLEHRKGNMHSVLDEAAYTFMRAEDEGDHEDILRAFFRLKVGEIGRLLVEVVDTTLKMSRETGRSLGSILPEANRVLYVSQAQPHFAFPFHRSIRSCSTRPSYTEISTRAFMGWNTRCLTHGPANLNSSNLS